VRRLNSKPVDKKIFTCPQCEKSRMSRLLDHVVSSERIEHKTRDGTTVSLFVDICDNCIASNYSKHFEPSRSNIRKVLKAMKEDAQANPDTSLEDLL
jgi:transcription elongation factor Elf1